MRVPYKPRASEASHIKHLQTGRGISHPGTVHVFHGHYGAGLAGLLGSRILIPAAKGAVRGSVDAILDGHSGGYSDKIKHVQKGAIRGAIRGAVTGRGITKKKSPATKHTKKSHPRPF